MQPHPEPMRLEVVLGPCRESLGTAYDSGPGLEDIESARRVLAELVAAGLFSWRAETSCMLEFHFHTADDWTEFIDRPKAGVLEADQRLLERGLAAMARGEGEIVASRNTGFSVHAREPARRP